MPNFDRSGPLGAGSMTGCARGLCGRRRGAQVAASAGVPSKPGRFRGRGRGFGYGRDPVDIERNDAAARPWSAADDRTYADPAERRAVLKAERQSLKSRLRDVEETLKAIGRNGADETDA